jgi:hypothetical protein
MGLFILLVITFEIGLAATAPSTWTRAPKDSISMFLLFANYIAMGLGLLGTLAPSYEKSYSPSWKTNGFLNLS